MVDDSLWQQEGAAAEASSVVATVQQQFPSSSAQLAQADAQRQATEANAGCTARVIVISRATAIRIAERSRCMAVFYGDSVSETRSAAVTVRNTLRGLGLFDGGWRGDRRCRVAQVGRCKFGVVVRSNSGEVAAANRKAAVPGDGEARGRRAVRMTRLRVGLSEVELIALVSVPTENHSARVE